MTIRDIIIIGSGPAGLTAAIYASRAELKPLMFEGYKAGGQLMLTSEVENYPGFEKGIMGPKLIEEMRKQALRFGTEIVTKDVTKVDFSKAPYTVEVGKDKYQAKTVIISTGANAKWLGLESEQKFMGRGVTSCATCDGAFYKGKEVVVIGGGDSAMEEALFLTKFASKVTIIHRRDEFRASKIMIKRAQDHEKIEIKTPYSVTEVFGEKLVQGVKVKHSDSEDIEEIPCNGMFVAIGHKPNTELFKDQLEVDEAGYLITKGKSTETNIKGVFACGDVQDHTYKQAITAAGSGCKSAIEAERYLAEHE